ncbi:MAG: hypothetical protein R3E54_06270 [Halioglobus sp.]
MDGAGAMAAALSFAVLYLLLSSPLYESTVRLRPPLAAQLAAINETGQLELTPDEAFNRVVFEARSLETQRAVFEAFRERLLADDAAGREQPEQYFRRQFAPSIRILIEGLQSDAVLAETTLSIPFQHTDSQLAADVANALAAAAQARALEGVLEDLSVLLQTRVQLLEASVTQSAETLRQADHDEIVRLQEEDELRRRTLQDQIDALTDKAYQLRLDRISELEEALSIARRLDITEPVTLRMLSGGKGGSSIAVSADLSDGSQDPLYLRGSRMLEAELATLRERTSDAYTVPELRELQMKLELLKQNRRIESLQGREDYVSLADNVAQRAEISQLRDLLDADYHTVQLARTDQLAIARSTPVQPRKFQVLATAAAIGIVLGLLAALFMIAVDNRRR